MTSDEGQMRAACIMRDAAESMQRSASTISEAVQQFNYQLADGYGGNGLCLLEQLRELPAQIQLLQAMRDREPDQVDAAAMGLICQETSISSNRAMALWRNLRALSHYAALTDRNPG